MNTLLIVAGVLSLSVVGGHFTVGRSRYLRPMLGADFDPVARRVMLCVFHYVSVNLVLMTLILLAAGFGLDPDDGMRVAVLAVAVHYGLYAIVQLVYALTAGIEQALGKMFQWVFFVVIAALAWIGSVG